MTTDAARLRAASQSLPHNLAQIVGGDLGVPSAIETLLEKLPTPVVRPGTATFLYSGAADGVDLLRWIGAGIERTPLSPIGSSDLWALELPVEDNGRFEYKLSVNRNGHEDWILDPRNPHRAGDPFGENSVCKTWGYERPDWSRPSNAATGSIETITVDSAVFGGHRSEAVYLPAAAPPEGGLPMVVVHDGPEYDHYASLTTSLDNLIAAGDIPPVLAVLTESPDRMKEYPRGRRHARYLVEELLPEVEARYRVSGERRNRVLMGASLGAVASLSTAFRYPGQFGGLVLKSGTFILDDDKLATRPHPVYRRTARLVQVLQRAPAMPDTRAFLHTGDLEGLADQNRAMVDVLQAKGLDVCFKSSWDGHHWHNWRNQLRDGLMWALGVDKVCD